MELALSLGDNSKPLPKSRRKDLGFSMGLVSSSLNGISEERSASDHPPPIQLNLLPFSSPAPRAHQPSPQLRLPWLSGKILTHLP